MNPLIKIVNFHVIDYPTPVNLNYWWNFGLLSAFCLGIQIVTGILLAMNYTPHVDLAMASVEHIMRDIDYGWLIRYAHANGASMFFIMVYIHIARGLYYGSYMEPKALPWCVGVVIFILMMATAFMGYVLPWGQMSFWGAQVAPDGKIVTERDGAPSRRKCQRSQESVGSQRPQEKPRSAKRIGPHNIDVLSIFFGSLLGDSWAEYRSGGSLRFTLQQENSNYEYLVWFHKYLQERLYCTATPPKKYSRLGVNGKVRYYYKVSSYSYSNLTWFYDMFYKNGKKHIPENNALEIYLTPLALAVWIMDDGSVSSAGLKIATNAFSLEDLSRTQRFLEDKYKLKCTVSSAGVQGQYVIYFWKQTMPVLSGLVKPYMVPSMYYKLNGF